MESVWPLKTLPRRFPEWVAERYPSAARELEKVNDGSTPFIQYAWRCIRHAEETRAWLRARDDNYVDRHEAERLMDAEFLAEAPKLAADFRRLGKRFKHFGTRAQWALVMALVRVKKRHGAPAIMLPEDDQEDVDFGEAEPDYIQSNFAELLSDMADVLEQEPFAKLGPLEHRLFLGNLLFTQPVDRHSARPKTSTSMLFSLALFARYFTAEQPHLLTLGTTMPQNGRPFWQVAVAFVSDVFAEDLTEDAARQRIVELIKRNPDVGWGGWLDPPRKYLDTPPRDSWR